MTQAARDTDEEAILEAYRTPPENLWPIVERVLRMPEHRHLEDETCTIAWLMRCEPKVKQGRQILGTCYMPRVNGELSGMFDWLLARHFGYMPTFLVTLDAGYWEDATPLQREILVFHELLHADRARDSEGEPRVNSQTGEPLWAIRGHDIEEFEGVVSRYGITDVHSVERFIEAARAGEASKNLRRVR